VKVLDVAFKDLSRSFRSAFAIVFMFGVPILMTGMFAFMFGGMLGGDGEEYILPRTTVHVTNLDQGASGFDTAFMADPGGENPPSFDSMGAFIVHFLQDQELADLIELTEVPDPALAREAVDNQQAGVALVIPENFTEAVLDPDGREQATLEFYQDPTLTLGPNIVKTIISQLVDSFSGTRIALGTVYEQLAEAELDLTVAQEQALLAQYLEGIAKQGEQQSEMGASAGIALQVPPGRAATEDDSQLGQILGLIMAGMMVFYAFFTGTSSAQNILEEEEDGTLPRLFTTPTPVTTILTGKFLAIGMTILVQVVVLLLFGRFAFGIRWGKFLPVALMTVGAVVAASTFGIFVMSFVKNTRQAGVIYGSVVTFTGMLGMIRTFTFDASNVPKSLDTITFLVPQGWILQGYSLAMQGRGLLGEFLLIFAALMVWSGVFFVVGRARLQRRFA
jgi:ABC-2 type transport system permease protein